MFTAKFFTNQTIKSIGKGAVYTTVTGIAMTAHAIQEHKQDEHFMAAHPGKTMQKHIHAINGIPVITRIAINEESNSGPKI